MNISRLHDNLLNRVRNVASNKGAQDPYMLHLDSRSICDAVGFYSQFWGLDFFDVCTDLIAAQSSIADSLIIAALELKHKGHLEAARIMVERAEELDRRIPYTRALAADLLREQGHRGEARKRCVELLQDFPRFGDAESCLTMCDVDDLLECPYDYYQLLDHAHRILKPGRYIEIGVSTGKSLALARTGTRAIGVDPMAANSEMHYFHSPEVEPLLFPITSNEFFRTMDQVPAVRLDRPAFDMAFIDGLHIFEQALMDFINLESCADSSSVIFIHDCLPVNTVVAERQRQTCFWTGDVWRVIPCLKALRPDLEIVTFPASPSGLAMITGLDPMSRILARQFDTLVSHFLTIPLPDSYEERCAMLNVTTADPLRFMEERIASATAL